MTRIPTLETGGGGGGGASADPSHVDADNDDKNNDDASTKTPGSTKPLDAIIAIGVLIKGETMHFEYIASAVSQGLMRVTLDVGVPVVFGVLTVLNEDQAWARAGVSRRSEGGVSGGGDEQDRSHNHGTDWATAAVEMASKRIDWAGGLL